MSLLNLLAVLTVTVMTSLTGFCESSELSQAAPQSSREDTRGAGAATAAALPKDIDSQSLSRLPLVKREDMEELGKKLYDSIVSGQARSLAGLQGPFGIWLYSPAMAQPALALNYYLRYEAPLGRRLTELAILVTARELDNQFEWTAHEPVALREGLEPQIINVVKYRRGISGLAEKEAVIISFGRELFGKRKVSSQTFSRAQKVFGNQGVVDLAALMGDYASITAIINAFDLQLRPDQKALLPPP